MEKFLVGYKRAIFTSIQESVAPRIASYPEKQKEDTILEVENFLATKSWSIKLKISLFLYILSFYSLLKYFKTIVDLSLKQREQLLSDFCDSPIPIMRKGFWGISTLAKLSVYSLEFIQKDLGYTQPSIEDMKKIRNKKI